MTERARDSNRLPWNCDVVRPHLPKESGLASPAMPGQSNGQ